MENSIQYQNYKRYKEKDSSNEAFDCWNYKQ